MEKLILTFNVILITTLLFNVASMHSMEIDYKEQALQPDFANLCAEALAKEEATQPSPTAMAGKLTAKAEEYNRSNPSCINLLTLPHDVLNQIFCFDQVKENKPYIKFILNNTPIYDYPPLEKPKPLENKIKFFMRLKTVCKHFNTLLTCHKIGCLCQNYDQKTKDNALQELYWQKYDHKTKVGTKTTKFRLPALILICAGADHLKTLWKAKKLIALCKGLS